MVKNYLQEEKTIKSDPYWFLMLFSNKRNQGSLEKWLFLELEQEKYTMSLEHLEVSENKEVLKKTKR